MVPDPEEVVLAESGAGDDSETLVGKSSDGEVALDPATLVEHLGVGQRPHAASYAIVCKTLQELGRAGTADRYLGEGCKIEACGGLATGARLGFDGGGPQASCPA